MSVERIDVPGDETGPLSPEQQQEMGQQPMSPEEVPEDGFPVPAKFMSEDGEVDVENLAAAYMELESRMGSQSQETEEAGGFTEEEQAAWSEEIAENGSLSDETIQELEERGFSRQMVETYVQGQKAMVQQARTQLLDPIGGEENYGDMMKWAAENLSESEIDSYDEVMMRGDMNAKAMMVQGLFSRYKQDNPSAPNLLQGTTPRGNTTPGFASWAQVTEAMRDPRYNNDPAYRDEVTRKLSVSGPLK